MIAEFVIHAPPTGKARPRVTSHGTYTPKKTKDYERTVRTEYLAQCAGMYFGHLPIAISITAYYPIPKSSSKAKREGMLAGRVRPIVKPDNDNVEKAVCDAMNGIAYHDDSQIVESHCRKFYGDEPKVIVKIETLKF